MVKHRGPDPDPASVAQMPDDELEKLFDSYCLKDEPGEIREQRRWEKVQEQYFKLSRKRIIDRKRVEIMDALASKQSLVEQWLIAVRDARVLFREGHAKKAHKAFFRAHELAGKIREKPGKTPTAILALAHMAERGRLYDAMESVFGPPKKKWVLKRADGSHEDYGRWVDVPAGDPVEALFDRTMGPGEKSTDIERFFRAAAQISEERGEPVPEQYNQFASDARKEAGSGKDNNVIRDRRLTGKAVNKVPSTPGSTSFDIDGMRVSIPGNPDDEATVLFARILNEILEDILANGGRIS